MSYASHGFHQIPNFLFQLSQTVVFSIRSVSSLPSWAPNTWQTVCQIMLFALLPWNFSTTSLASYSPAPPYPCYRGDKLSVFRVAVKYILLCRNGRMNIARVRAKCILGEWVEDRWSRTKLARSELSHTHPVEWFNENEPRVFCMVSQVIPNNDSRNHQHFWKEHC